VDGFMRTGYPNALRSQRLHKYPELVPICVWQSNSGYRPRFLPNTERRFRLTSIVFDPIKLGGLIHWSSARCEAR